MASRDSYLASAQTDEPGRNRWAGPRLAIEEFRVSHQNEPVTATETKHDSPGGRSPDTLGWKNIFLILSIFTEQDCALRVFDEYIFFVKAITMIWTIAVVLFVLWLFGFAVFHVAGGLIHLLLVLAVIAIVYQLVTGRRAV